MKAIVAVLVFVAVVAALPNPNSFKDKFKEFQTKYNKTYATTEEHDTRFKNFVRNMAKAQYWQRRETGTATYGMTKFSDLSEQEFITNYLMPNELHKTFDYNRAPVLQVVNASLPQDGMDWRDKGAVTPVYNQGSCGSCWAFSATETIESYYKLCGHSLASLSVQQMVDCDKTSYGCQGGWTESAYEYILGAKGQESWSKYPYTGYDGSCKFNTKNVAAKISSWGYVTTPKDKDEAKMLSWVNSNGPVSVCVDASQWNSYTGGVVRTCGRSLNHCVMVTGYSTVSNYPVWHVRNSWGTDWGISGYMYVERNKDVCGIAQDVTAVVC